MTFAHRFQIPVGDWSDDGHGRCEWFKVSSNKSVEQVRELLFAITEQHYPQFAELFADYEQTSLTAEQYKALIGHAPAAAEHFEVDGGDAYLTEGPEGYVRVLLEVLRAFDSELVIALEDEERLPMLPFYGYDAQGRHLRYGGYGLFVM